jgi:hypothetical protein
MSWPSSAALDDIEKCSTCGIHVYADTPGSLQVLTRRQGTGVGDGVNIEENVGIGADYRGQRYTFQEAILHVPGLHIFPGNKEVYPAEYHIHMQTFSQPQRALTLVLPVTHRDLTSTAPGQDYFAAVAARPDPSATRPALSTLLVPGTPMLQYQGPDIRGRTGATPTTPACDPDTDMERQFLLVLGAPLRIRATDLERIPREGSLSTDPRDLPAPGVRPKSVLPRDRLRRCVVLATPGIIGPGGQHIIGPGGQQQLTSELECKPLKVVNGQDVIDVSGQTINIVDLLGLGGSGGLLSKGGLLGASAPTAPATGKEVVTGATKAVAGVVTFICTAFGFWAMSWVFGWLWKPFFEKTDRLTEWITIKKFAMIAVIFGATLNAVL